MASLAWKPAPNSRRLLLDVRAGDPKPADPYAGEWWSGWYAIIEWQAAGRWEWTVWAPQRHASGPARDWGEAPTAGRARQMAAACLLRLLPDPSDDERAQLASTAAIADAV